MNQFKIHPAIGCARIGNSESFYLAPEQTGALPIECDDRGREIIDEKGLPVRVSQFKEAGNLGGIKRQAARFRIFVYDENQAESERELKIGDKFQFPLNTSTTGPQMVEGTVVDIEWTVHLANKKASWYAFSENDGMHGYGSDHPLRNPEVTQPDRRRQLTIDPGPRTVSGDDGKASFSRNDGSAYPQSFPPQDIQPCNITTLGEMMVNEDHDQHRRLIVLGGYGRAGYKGADGNTVPVISHYANNDGWYDDVSDGPVRAQIKYSYIHRYTDAQGKPVRQKKFSFHAVDAPAWLLVGYPSYAPEIEDMITMDEAIYDLSVRNFAYDPAVYGVAPFDRRSNQPQTMEQWAVWRSEAEYNPNYFPHFFRDIWPIFNRPDNYSFTYDFDPFGGGVPHNRGAGGNLDKVALSQPPKNGLDPNRQHREFIYAIMRKPGQENRYTVPEDLSEQFVASFHNSASKPRLMPMLNGNNPINNTVTDKFLRMTDTQLFFLKQWMEGKFINECDEWGEGNPTCDNPWAEPPITGSAIDRGVLGNVLGGAFCPGAEVGWIMLNPAIYSSAYRIHQAAYIAGGLSIPAPVAVKDGSQADDIARGMEPGDLTKYMGLPWQADFHECTDQNINVTYEMWNDIYPGSTGDPVKQAIAYNIPWWPGHRPMVIQKAGGGQYYWASGIPDNYAGGVQMVSDWINLGFIKFDPNDGNPGYYQVERNDKALGPQLQPGQRTLGGEIKGDTDNE
ncbi:LodA/GoxA family CTQ-dependent oxidase [Nitrosomonas sp.]|uniref:LodA/GoxA family CTQ-dependent oxidase n=1 Tax=Nitrosomonas sp. TaxID=42353 RepID=UPI0025F3912A|nr:LodA/GoxA family CTQ-dependent oxidase [Nitrosomonas sp.]